MQLLPIWFIILLATNLSADHSENFVLLHKSANVVNEYRITHTFGNRWTLNHINAPERLKNAELHFEIVNGGTLHTTDGQTASIDFCAVKKTDWKTVTEIPMTKKAIKEGWTSILVTRTENGFSLSQEKGVLEHERVLVTWEN